MKRPTVTIDRTALLAALNKVEQALIRGDATAALRALGQVYKLVPVELGAQRPAR